MHPDTDSDVAEQRDGGKVKVKWTQEEVIVLTCPSYLHFVAVTADPVALWDREHKQADLFMFTG